MFVLIDKKCGGLGMFRIIRYVPTSDGLSGAQSCLLIELERGSETLLLFIQSF